MNKNNEKKISKNKIRIEFGSLRSCCGGSHQDYRLRILRNKLKEMNIEVEVDKIEEEDLAILYGSKNGEKEKEILAANLFDIQFELEPHLKTIKKFFGIKEK